MLGVGGSQCSKQCPWLRGPRTFFGGRGSDWRPCDHRLSQTPPPSCHKRKWASSELWNFFSCVVCCQSHSHSYSSLTINRLLLDTQPGNYMRGTLWHRTVNIRRNWDIQTPSCTFKRKGDNTNISLYNSITTDSLFSRTAYHICRSTKEAVWQSRKIDMINRGVEAVQTHGRLHQTVKDV